MEAKEIQQHIIVAASAIEIRNNVLDPIKRTPVPIDGQVTNEGHKLQPWGGIKRPGNTAWSVVLATSASRCHGVECQRNQKVLCADENTVTRVICITVRKMCEV